MPKYRAYDRTGKPFTPGGKLVFGPLEKAWLERRERAKKKRGQGKGLRIERVVSPGTRIVQVAQAELKRKVREIPSGSNRGPRVDDYQNADDLAGVGYAWCVSFCQFVLREAGYRIDYRGASVYFLTAWAKAAGKWTLTPKPGYIAVMEFDGRGAYDHVGIVETVDPVTIEGNTSSGRQGSQADGQGVHRRSDRAGEIVGYVKTY